jgi:ParB family chromosome partitioning protein
MSISAKDKFARVRSKLTPENLARAQAAGRRVAEESAPVAPVELPEFGALQARSSDLLPTKSDSQTTAPELGALQASSCAWQVGRVYEITHGRLKPNPLNPRVFYLPEKINELAASMERQGQTTAATGFVEGDFVVLIEGHTRQKAASQLGWPSLRVEIRPKPADLRKLYEEAHTANDERSNPSPLDDALRWKQLLNDKVYPSQRSLATAIGKDEGDVSRTLALNDMSQSVIQSLAEAPSLHTAWTLRSIAEFWRACGDDETHTLIVEAKHSNLSGREIKKRQEAILAGPSQRPRAAKASVEFRGRKGELKTFEDGRVQLLLKGLSHDEAEEIKKRLTAALAG